jgi:hypothetical protein
MKRVDIYSKIIDLFCECFEQDDPGAFADLFIDDAVYVDNLYGAYEGREAIKGFHARCHEEAKTYRFLPMNHLFNNRDMAAFEWQLSFVSMMSLSKNKEITVEGSGFLTLKDGQISSYREYTDSIAILLKGNVPNEKIMKFYRQKYK